jgi:metal-sulfur cluster biosynthetic enzyme
MTAPRLNESLVRAALRQVVDPELNCNIVDLGLIHAIAIVDSKVTIAMTLTSPGCPMHESIAAGVQRAARQLDGVEDVEVQLVWEPPWTPSRMTDYGREQTGVVER